MRLFAPYNAPTAHTFVPNPMLDDSLAPRRRMLIRPMMDGSRRTLISHTDRLRLGVSFKLYIDKAHELREFGRAYRNVEWGMEFEDGKIYRVYLMTNPISFDTPRRDTVEITIEFQGLRVL